MEAWRFNADDVVEYAAGLFVFRASGAMSLHGAASRFGGPDASAQARPENYREVMAARSKLSGNRVAIGGR
jgi:hypothetical protein